MRDHAEDEEATVTPILTLPWPPSALSPNSRTDRRASTGQRRAYLEAGFYAVKKVRAVIPADADLAIKFFPPDRKRRDMDNMFASIKSGLDGIAMAAGVDDSGWSFTLDRGASVKGGSILIQIRPARPDGWQGVMTSIQHMIQGQIS